MANGLHENNKYNYHNKDESLQENNQKDTSSPTSISGPRISNQELNDFSEKIKPLKDQYLDLVAYKYDRIPLPFPPFNKSLKFGDIYVDIPLILRQGRKIASHVIEEDNQKFISDLIKREDPTIIIGSLGDGKSTALNHISWLYSQKEYDPYLWGYGELNPYFVKFTTMYQYWSNEDFAQGPKCFIRALAKSVVNELGGTMDAESLEILLLHELENKLAIIMLDGLDELIIEQSNTFELFKSVLNLWRLEPFTNNTLLITSRTFLFKRTLSSDFNFYQPPLYLFDLGGVNVELLIQRLGRVLLEKIELPSNTKVGFWIDELKNSILVSRWKHYHNPFYITLMIYICTSALSITEGIELLKQTKRRSEIIELFLFSIIEWEYSKGRAQSFSKFELIRIISHIALYILVNTQNYKGLVGILTRELDINPLDVENAIKIWWNANVIDVSFDFRYISFKHQGFQIYGAAFALADLYKRGDYEKVRKIKERYLTNPNWSDIWEFYTGMILE